MNIDLTGLTSLIVSIGTLIGVYITLRKQRADAVVSEASAAELYEQMAARVGSRLKAIEAENAENCEEIRKLKAQVADQDIKIKAQETEIIALRLALKEAREKIDLLEVENGDLKRWAEKLVKQVIALGGVPEKVDKKK